MKSLLKSCKSFIWKYKILIISLLLVSICGSIFGVYTYLSPKTSPAENKLAIPALIDTKQEEDGVEVQISQTEHEFFEGVKSKTLGYNQSYLGPTIKLYNGEDTRIKFNNLLEEDTTVHGHGLHVPGNLDGGPQSRIKAGDEWDIVLPIRQQASTNWYHPHLMGTSAGQIHAGLAGMYIIEDENSQNLPLPKDYGVNDIPLIIQDRNFSDGKMDNYSVSDAEMMTGKREQTIVVNGTVDPYIEAPQGWLRLRLLNASNSRFYDFHLEDNEPFYKIATEGGFLEKPVEIDSMRMTPGERNEIMIDLSDGNTRNLLATMIPVDDDFIGELFTPVRRVLEIKVNSEKEAKGSLPKRLNTIIPLKKEDAVVTRDFELQMELGESSSHNHRDTSNSEKHSIFAINGKSMDMSRIDERVNKGDIEIWRITRDEMDHNFHMHGASFLILSQNGRVPKPEDRGWKDTVEIGFDWTEVIVRFDHEATNEYPYMYHCHIFEHEEGGMMGQFTVSDT